MRRDPISVKRAESYDSPGEADEAACAAAGQRRARDVRVAPYTLRTAQPGETLIEVAAVGICGSDLHYYKDGANGSAKVGDAFTPGHEFGGYVCEDIPELGLHRGALVAVDPNGACGQCEWRREGYGGQPLVVEATNSPLGFRDAVSAAWIGGRVILAGIPDGGGGRAAARPQDQVRPPHGKRLSTRRRPHRFGPGKRAGGR